MATTASGAFEARGRIDLLVIIAVFDDRIFPVEGRAVSHCEPRERRHRRGVGGPKEITMSDDKTKRGAGDRSRISLNQDYEVRDWAKKFGVTETELRAAVERVGNQADDVQRELGGRR